MTSHSEFNLGLSRRLQKIDNMVFNQEDSTQHIRPYSHVWDCCCDHGLLGCSLLSKPVAQTIHFVDIVPKLMLELNNKLARFYPDQETENTTVNKAMLALPTWKTHCIDVGKLPIKGYIGKQLIIIAGVGGDLMTQFVETIIQSHPNQVIEFLLCPVHHQFTLRNKLIELDMKLIDEQLVEDNKRFYEVIHVSTTSPKVAGDSPTSLLKIHPVGDKIWSANSTEQLSTVNKYLSKTLKHYHRIQQGAHQDKKNDVEHIIKAYRAIIPSINK